MNDRPVSTSVYEIQTKIQKIYNQIMTNNYAENDAAFTGMVFILLGIIGLQFT